MSAQDWTVRSVKPGKTEPNPHGGGNLQKFYVDVVGADGDSYNGVYWRRKEGNDPEVGQSYNGEVTEGKYGPLFRQSKGAFSGSSSPKESTVKKRDWTPEADRDPERSARILRQHSQEMAVRTLTAMGLFSDLGPGAPAKDWAHAEGWVVRWADFFDADVDKAGKAALQGAGGPSASPPSPPAPGKRPVDLQEIEEALDNAGLTDPKTRGAVALYMVGNLPDDRLTKAVKNIAQHEDLARQRKTLDSLEEMTKKHLGGELPTSEKPHPDDDIPF